LAPQQIGLGAGNPFTQPTYTMMMNPGLIQQPQQQTLMAVPYGLGVLPPSSQALLMQQSNINLKRPPLNSKPLQPQEQQQMPIYINPNSIKALEYPSDKGKSIKTYKIILSTKNNFILKHFSFQNFTSEIYSTFLVNSLKSHYDARRLVSGRDPLTDPLFNENTSTRQQQQSNQNKTPISLPPRNQTIVAESAKNIMQKPLSVTHYLNNPITYTNTNNNNSNKKKLNNSNNNANSFTYPYANPENSHQNNMMNSQRTNYSQRY
jgi:hypothetical protein